MDSIQGTHRRSLDTLMDLTSSKLSKLSNIGSNNTINSNNAYLSTIGSEYNNNDFNNNNYKISQVSNIPVKSFSSRYKHQKKLGSGSFGVVGLYEMCPGVYESNYTEMKSSKGSLLYPLSINYKLNDNLVAIKTMSKTLKRTSDYSKIKEMQFIFSVDSHFNLVQIMDVFIDRHHFKLHIVMETMQQNLYQVMKSRKHNIFSAKTLKSILFQLLSAISHIHKHLFFHRDVKPENILVSCNVNYFGSPKNIPENQIINSYIVKLADYGLARHSTNKKQFTAYVSTRWYRSPEILLRQNYYSYPVDIWAFGCVAVECATFIPLFPGANELDQCNKMMDFLGNPTTAFYNHVLKTNNISAQSFKNQNNEEIKPFGGFWDDSKLLASKLGITFPNHFGNLLENFIKKNDFPGNEREHFFKMIRKCLTWDPKDRATANEIFQMPYFQNSIYSLNNQKENNLFIKNYKGSDRINQKIINPLPISNMIKDNYNDNYRSIKNIQLSTNPHMKFNQQYDRNYITNDQNNIMVNNINNNNNNNNNNDSNKNMKTSLMVAGISPSKIVYNSDTNNNSIDNHYGYSQNPNLNLNLNLNMNLKLSPYNHHRIKNSNVGLGVIQPTAMKFSRNKQINNHSYQNHNSDDLNNISVSDQLEDYNNFMTEPPLNDDYETSLNLISQLIDEEENNNDENISNGKIKNPFKKINVDDIDENEVDNEEIDEDEDEDDDEEDDEDEDYDEEEQRLEKELLSLEMNKVALFLEESEKDSNNEVYIHQKNEKNYDLIDEIDLALDEELTSEHPDLSWRYEK